MRPLWFAEVDPFPSAVLDHYWPGTLSLGDMTHIRDMLDLGIINVPDILVGGTPCQSFSVAGSRKGLNDQRGQLALEYVRLLDVFDTHHRERGGSGSGTVCVWENVPGVLSSKDNAFGHFIGALAGEDGPLIPSGRKWTNAGYVLGPKRTVVWRVLNAQYFGVAQRRRRVFVIASARTGFDPRQVLFEFGGVRRDTPPSQKTGAHVAALTASGAGTCGADDNQAQAGHLVAVSTSGEGTWRTGIGPLRARAQDSHENLICFNSRQDPAVYDGVSGPCDASLPQSNAVFGTNSIGGDVAPCVDASIDRKWGSNQWVDSGQGVLLGGTVRRLTPIECERLQGFRDNYTRIAWRGKPATACPDGHRYRAIGNSMAVPVMRWIGERIIREFSND